MRQNVPTGDVFLFTANGGELARIGETQSIFQDQFQIHDNNTAAILVMLDDETTPTDDNVIGNIRFQSDTDTTPDTIFTNIRALTGDVTNATSSGKMQIRVRDDNALTTYIVVDGELERTDFHRGIVTGKHLLIML